MQKQEQTDSRGTASLCCPSSLPSRPHKALIDYGITLEHLCTPDLIHIQTGPFQTYY